MVQAVALALLAAGTVQAHGGRRGHRGSSCGMYSGGGYSNYGAGCGCTGASFGYASAGPAQMITYQAVTEYVTVNRQVCTYEPVTTEEEYTEVTFKPNEKKEEREEVYYTQETVKKKVKQKVMRLVGEKKKMKVMVPTEVKKKVEQKWTTYERVITKEKRKGTQMVQQTRAVTQTVPVTTWERVAVPGCQTVRVRVPCPPSPCGGPPQCGCCYANVTVPTVTYRCVPKTVNQTYTYNVCEYVAKPVEFEVEVCNLKPKEHKQEVEVTFCEMKEKEEEVTVNSWKEVEEEVEVAYCEMKENKRKVPVTVITYERKEEKKKRPVTTYKLVTKTVAEKVPVTRYVQVVVPCGPSYTPPPCGY
jgi:hypothetical protein